MTFQVCDQCGDEFEEEFECHETHHLECDECDAKMSHSEAVHHEKTAHIKVREASDSSGLDYLWSH